MPHSHVADRFFLKRRPQLTLYTHVRDATIGAIHGYKHVSFDLIVGIGNEGKAMAKYPYLSTRVHEPFKVSRGRLHNGRDGLRELRWNHPRDPHRYVGDANDVVHRESHAEVAVIWGEIQNLENPPCDDVVIDYEIMAEDTEPVSGQKVLPIAEIVGQARPA